MSRTIIDAPAGVPFIDISREFDAPRDLVWRAWTEPELLKQWLGPHRYEMIIDEYDVRDGGRWRYVHRGADGDEHGFHGVFHGTPSPDGFLQTFEYEGAPGHVSMDRLVLEARDAMIENGMEGGMNEGFDRLDQLLARLQPAAVH